jgi:hypothetical protein
MTMNTKVPTLDAQDDIPIPPPPLHIMQFFAYEHLPQELQEVSRPFCELAKTLTDKDALNLPRNPELSVALRKLIEAKDAAVRARLSK